jgi:hypothetical protein
VTLTAIRIIRIILDLRRHWPLFGFFSRISPFLRDTPAGCFILSKVTFDRKSTIIQQSIDNSWSKCLTIYHLASYCGRIFRLYYRADEWEISGAMNGTNGKWNILVEYPVNHQTHQNNQAIKQSNPYGNPKLFIDFAGKEPSMPWSANQEVEWIEVVDHATMHSILTLGFRSPQVDLGETLDNQEHRTPGTLRMLGSSRTTRNSSSKRRREGREGWTRPGQRKKPKKRGYVINISTDLRSLPRRKKRFVRDSQEILLKGSCGSVSVRSFLYLHSRI